MEEKPKPSIIQLLLNYVCLAFYNTVHRALKSSHSEHCHPSVTNRSPENVKTDCPQKTAGNRCNDSRGWIQILLPETKLSQQGGNILMKLMMKMEVLQLA